MSTQNFVNHVQYNIRTQICCKHSLDTSLSILPGNQHTSFRRRWWRLCRWTCATARTVCCRWSARQRPATSSASVWNLCSEKNANTTTDHCTTSTNIFFFFLHFFVLYTQSKNIYKPAVQHTRFADSLSVKNKNIFWNY